MSKNEKSKSGKDSTRCLSSQATMRLYFLPRVRCQRNPHTKQQFERSFGAHDTPTMKSTPTGSMHAVCGPVYLWYIILACLMSPSITSRTTHLGEQNPLHFRQRCAYPKSLKYPPGTTGEWICKNAALGSIAVYWQRATHAPGVFGLIAHRAC